MPDSSRPSRSPDTGLARYAYYAYGQITGVP